MATKKKLVQAARREARNAMKGYRDSLSERLSVFNDVLRDRPFFMPRFLWRWISNRVIDLDKIDKLFKH